MRPLFRVVATSAAIATLGLVGCGGSSSSTTAAADPCDTGASASAVVAKSGELAVTQQEFDAELLSIPERARERYNNDKGRKSIAERILLNKALCKEASTQGVTSDAVVQTAARLAAQKSYVAALTSKVQGGAVSEESVQKYYEENKDKYSKPMVKARHVLVKDEAQAKDAKKRLDAGEDFAKVAEELSTDPGSKKRGGDLGWFTKERMVPEFSEVAFVQELNKISEPVKSKFGYHVIQTTEKRDTQPLEEVRAGIERLLSSNAVKDYTDKIKGGLNVELVGAFTSAAGSDAAAPPAGGPPGMSVTIPAPAGGDAAPAPMAPAEVVAPAGEKHE